MADIPRPGFATTVLALLVALMVLTLLFTPRAGEERGRLSSYSAAPGGARALHDAAQRLGWQVERRTDPFTAVPDSAAVYLVLDPAVTVTAGEVHRLLEAVRAGAGLLMIARPNDALTDSLGLARSARGLAADGAPGGFCPDSLNRQGLITWPDGRVHSWWLESYPQDGAVSFVYVRREQPTVDLQETTRRPRVTVDTMALPAMIGFPLGRGRVVAAADPDLLRNDVLRVCRWHMGITSVRALHWLAPPGTRPLVFDEFHQGYGEQLAPYATIFDALAYTPAGRMVLQMAAAALVLLLAAAIRPLAPRPRERIERRSALEHVGALARAYQQVGATRLATRRLVRGLRRRHALGDRARGGTGDEEFLASLAARHAALRPQVTLLERALANPVADNELDRVGEAVAHIEEHLRPIPSTASSTDAR